MKSILSLVFICLFVFVGCAEQGATPKFTVKKAVAKVKTQANGLTVEQTNVKKRLEAENTPGAIKHLYVISAMSGQTIIYSTVKGKVTSSGKRLSPKSVGGGESYGRRIVIKGDTEYTDEVLGDDGTYGSSISYLYWWDVQGRYHQHYVSGGQIIHVSNQPIAVKDVIINMEMVN